jgi:hypothetical protein
MARWLKQSTSVDVPIGPFVDATDGVTAETGLTITQPDIRLKKNGGAWAQKNAAQTLTHEENGYYEVTLDATDTNTLGLLRLAVNESGALPVWEDFLVVPANVWDSFFASDLLDVNISQFGGTNGTFASGRPEVNATHAAGTAWNSGAIGAATLAADTLTAAKVASDVGTEIGTAVWATATRTLTANPGLDAAGIRTAVGLASANLDTQLGTIDTNVDAVLEDTGTTLPATLSTIAGYIDTEVAAIVTTLGTPAGASVSADIAAIKAETASILTDTAEIGAAGAGLTALASQSSVNTIDDFLDTEIAAIKAKTDQLTFTNTGVVDANITHVISDPVQANGSTTTNWGGAPA